ncbi:hypothetical protein QBC33DRAFT_5148 [Phialemonium atrogriseum]|uniref:3-oxo-5-alpha-steroid 4-dehydrogenase C-terminal domain-containing protein n=1 Tax=Phialemonium atrogriseum TaxID=1093897 RepID=A0AAJ0CBR6_9PEZI|nr:uncharacterized protein QBC33DRAFT_5148 [Phialemonium atrogriseum]KAK1772309.1 hypothetical protein QBC33DRAFT_5148 [Phialemonium atrogriseum]
MALIQDWAPPTKEHYESILFIWKFFPLAASLQWLISWYGMGKTSVNSRFNIPGRIAWVTMESPGFLLLLYIMNTLPQQHGITDLPWQNKVLAGLFVIHYSYRAVLFPLMQPSMSPVHGVVWASALCFQLTNATCLGGWLAAYGPTTEAAWRAQLAPFPTAQFALGAGLFYAGLAANYYHDDELREIRRREIARLERVAREGGGRGGGVEKHYRIPTAGLFKILLYPHYFAEWIEWMGFWIACGVSCQPAMMFVVNEIASMLPRAVKGKRWYEEKFGKEKIRGKWAVIPGVL